MEIRIINVSSVALAVFSIVLIATNTGVFSCHSHIARHIIEEYKELGCDENEIYHQESDKCYYYDNRTREVGPCGNNMFLVRTMENHKRARCECFDDTPRTLIYDKKTEQCYFILSQGPCKANRHINFVNGTPRCVVNPCAREQIQAVKNKSQDEFVMYSGVCKKLDSPCAKGVLTFASENPNVPTCQRPHPQLRAIGAIGVSKCPVGMFPNLTGKCQEAVELDF